MFTDTQKAALAADLDRKAVRQRAQAGRQLSYIEGWHAIAEANRIFGFDGWTRETVELRAVTESPRKIGKDERQRDGWAVSYIAKVRITVFAGDMLITREGAGSGHGIDVDLGQAHESALKEAETDAMKRALMTFGNPFGLALYDKGQTHVSDAPAPAKAEPHAPAKAEPVNATKSAKLASEMIAELQHLKAMNSDQSAFKRWTAARTNRGDFRLLTEPDLEKVRDTYTQTAPQQEKAA